MIFASLDRMFIHLYPIYNQHIIWLSSLFGKEIKAPSWNLRPGASGPWDPLIC